TSARRSLCYRQARPHTHPGDTRMANNLFDLTGKVALVTGGSRGLGKAMARGFAAAGAGVVLSRPHPAELPPAPDQIVQRTRRRGKYVVCGLSRRDEAGRLAAAALELKGRVDILINNAGTNAPQPIDQVRDEDWDRVLELNLSSIMALTRALAPQMKERRWGRI